MDFDCTVEAVEKEAVTCRVVSCHAADTEPKQSITLFMEMCIRDRYYIAYEESELTGLEGTKTTVKLDGKTVALILSLIHI